VDLAQLSDVELVEESRRLPEAARLPVVDALFARYYATVARWSYRFTGDRDSAGDLAQDVFLKAHRHLDSFRGTARFSTWLYAIVRNESLTWRRRVATFPETQDDESLIDVATAIPGPEAAAAEGSRRDRLNAFLSETLTEEERTVFVLHYGDDMSLDAVTRLLGLENASGAKAYIVSAKRKLARAARRLQARGEDL